MSDLYTTLRELQAQRRNCIRMQTRITNNLGAMARRLCGWRGDLDEKERNRITKEAAALVASLSRETADTEDILDTGVQMLKQSLGPFVAVADQSRAPYDALRKGIEKEMKDLVLQTPGAAFMQATRGFGPLSLAVIVGEAGDLSNYANPAKLWKRLGLAPNEAYDVGENGNRKVPRRVKAEIFACVGDPLMKMNGEGIYRTEYLTRKEAYIAAGRTKGHAHLSAMRVMEKRLLRDLWAAWHGKTSIPLEPNNPMSSQPTASQEPGRPDKFVEPDGALAAP